MKAARWFPALLGIAFACAGMLHISESTKTMYEAIDSRKWPATSGQVIESRVAVSQGNRINYTPRVAYSYEAGAKLRTSTEIWLKSYGADQAFAEDVVAAYPTGAEIKVFFDPQNPARAVLRPGPNWFLVFWCVLSWLITGTGIALLVYSWRQRPGRNDA